MVGRQREIEEIERIRGSRVITYVTGDRNPVSARIGDDAVRPFFDVLRELDAAEQIDCSFTPRAARSKSRGASHLPFAGTRRTGTS